MSRKSIVLLLGASLVLFSSLASAHDTARFGVFVSGPAYSAPLYPYTPPPVYYSPPAVYYAPPAPVYYAPPAAMYYTPRPYYYGPNYHGYGHGYTNGWGHHRR